MQYRFEHRSDYQSCSLLRSRHHRALLGSTHCAVGSWRSATPALCGATVTILRHCIIVLPRGDSNNRPRGPSEPPATVALDTIASETEPERLAPRQWCPEQFPPAAIRPWASAGGGTDASSSTTTGRSVGAQAVRSSPSL